MAEYWISKAIKQKSGLREQLHMKTGETIKPEVLEKIKAQPIGTHVVSHGKSVPVTKKLKKRATLAMTLKKLQRKKRYVK